MLSYKQAIRNAEIELEKAEKSMQLAKIFMVELTNAKDINLYLVYEDEIDASILEVYTNGIQRMLQDEPMQYILGYETFYGRNFDVNKDVLIPRPETEELVANALSLIDDIRESKEHPVILDVGCGSGAIGISLKLEEPSIQMYASDISEEALVVAKSNAKKLEADIEFLQGSMLEPFLEKGIKADGIVCNPPYIRQDANLEATVVDYEPNIALFGGEDGLYFYKLVFDHALEVLNPSGFMAFEIGFDQKDALLKEVNTRFPNASSEVLQDMFGKDRMLIVNFGIKK